MLPGEAPFCGRHMDDRRGRQIQEIPAAARVRAAQRNPFIMADCFHALRVLPSASDYDVLMRRAWVWATGQWAWQ